MTSIALQASPRPSRGSTGLLDSCESRFVEAKGMKHGRLKAATTLGVAAIICGVFFGLRALEHVSSVAAWSVATAALIAGTLLLLRRQ
jgi:hypothetical protein